jgi:flagellar hook-basal body complex protein FliE
MSTPTAAANAYSSLARLADPSSGLASALGNSDVGVKFGSVLKDVVATVNEAARKSDQQSQSLAGGKANIVDVVTAVAETEVAIEALVSVRDRVIQAYEEIMRMPI